MNRRDRKTVRNVTVTFRENRAPEPGAAGMKKVQELVATVPAPEKKEQREPEHVRG